MFTIYAMNEDRKNFIWKDVRYIGMSKRIEARFAQHLACSDPDQPEKNDWIRFLLSQGIMPGLWCVEEIEEVKKAREREQYWIRYAMSQGAQLLNKQITYTPEERVKAHQERAEYYAQIQELLLQGYFVKRSIYWYPSSLKGLPAVKSVKRITAVDFVSLYVKDEQGNAVHLGTCSDVFFDALIKRHLAVFDGGYIEWDWGDRLQAINAANRRGINLGLIVGPALLAKEPDVHPLEPLPAPSSPRPYPDLEGE